MQKPLVRSFKKIFVCKKALNCICKDNGDYKMKKVCVIGHFGVGENLSNGQTIKTKIITEALINRLGENEVIKIDTYGGKKNLIKSPFQVINAYKNAKNIIILPAHNGLRIYTPLLSFFRHFFKKRKLHYVVIGGWLPDFIKSKRLLKKQLKKFDCIYVETDSMKIALKDQGFNNVVVMPNCKKLPPLAESELVYSTNEPYKLCTFSRVMKEKGIEDAVNAVKAVNEHFGRTVFELDIYGQVDSNQTEWFEKLSLNFPTYIRYGGLVPFDKSVDVLKDYFALLFPTYYEGEGFAGTLIDAYSAGVPVIASDWKYNAELVNENVGFVYPTGDQRAFVDILKAMAVDPTLLLCKKRLCLIEADKYKIDKAVQILIEQIEGD